MIRPDPAALLSAYDAQLRADAPSAVARTRLGPLHLVTFPWGWGWVTYRDLDGADAATIRCWVGDAVAHFRSRSGIQGVKWKARGHDPAPGLREALLDHGFEEQDHESVMIGEAGALAVDVVLPAGMALRRIHRAQDVRRMSEMQGEVSGSMSMR